MKLIKEDRPVYSLTNYMLLGRTLYYIPYLSMIHPGRVISTFVGLDVIVEILTGNGAAKIANLSNSPEQIRIGNGLIRASLLLQIVLFALFVSLEVIFHMRLIKAGIMNKKLKVVVALLYGSSALILVRNIYRCIEVWQGYTGYLQRHEAFFYVFDAGLMLANTVMLNIWHPARYLPKSNKTYLAKDGVTELEGPGWVDPRPWWVTTLDPFDVVGLIKGKDKKTAFWENESAQAETVRAKEVSNA
ncbi:hypothetical protein ACLMJK_002050 [Lecanora helva]